MKKLNFPITFDEGCQECTFDLDPDKLTDEQKLIFDLLEETQDTPVKCVVCQLRIAVALNGPYPGANTQMLQDAFGWVSLEPEGA